MPTSRWSLWAKVALMRLAGSLLGYLHRLAWPWPPNPSFRRTVPSTVSPRHGKIDLVFYTPAGYQSRSSTKRFPVVLNFHGGGFVVGTPTDDARWVQVVLDHCNAIVVSVAYRLAPEHPFPTAVEDGVDAMLYLIGHADEFAIDVNRIATSGFSAGGNLAITVPLRWQEELRLRKLMADPRPEDKSSAASSFSAIVAWYPSTDFTLSRAERRATCVRPDKTLPKSATDVFDESYIYPPSTDRSNPYLSPLAASDEILKTLPNDVILYTCEFDMLQKEAERFKDRCQDSLGKKVRFRMVEGVTHGWDKSFHPFMDYTEITKLYREACMDLNTVFNATIQVVY